MKKAILLMMASIMLVSSAGGQTLPRAKEISDYWQAGEKRIYRFMADSIEIGKLEVVHSGVKDGLHEISEKLNLSFFKVGVPELRSTETTMHLHPSGHIQYSDLFLTIDTVQQQNTAVYDSIDMRMEAIIDGNMTRNYHAYVDSMVYPCDDNLFDHIELILAMHDLIPGQKFMAPVYSMRGLYATVTEFEVIGKTIVRYGQYADSVWQVNMIAPAQLSIYVDSLHRMVKLEYPDRGLIVELERDILPGESLKQASTIDKGFITNHISRLPIYGFFLIVTIIWLAFYARDSIKIHWSYLLFIIGILVYPLIHVTQVPLQLLYVNNVIVPELQAGKTTYFLSIISALIVGVTQNILKVLPLILFVNLINTKRYIYVSLGAFLGAGFGFAEAVYVLGPAYQAGTLLVVAAIERVFTVLFHMTLGALLAYGIARRQLWRYCIYAVALQFFANYPLVFIRSGLLSINTLMIIYIVYYLILFGVTKVLQRNFKLGYNKLQRGRNE